MDVRFYFDPLCPWCWVTSRWLEQEVRPRRELDVDFRSISLKVRNADKDQPAEWKERQHASHRLLRVVEAVRAAGHAAKVGDLYTELGRRIHHDKDLHFDPADALAAVGLDEDLAKAADDPAWDAAVEASTAEAEAAAGDDVGTPIIAIEVYGEWRGYFGPVIPELVRGEDAVRLWDALVVLMRTPGMYELKRTRTQRPVMPELTS